MAGRPRKGVPFAESSATMPQKELPSAIERPTPPYVGRVCIVVAQQKPSSPTRQPHRREWANERGGSSPSLSDDNSLLFFTAFSTTISIMDSFPDIPIDTRALYVLNKLEGAGYSAWLVGGCVRDAFMGTKANDYDIATSAPWQKTSSLFKEAGHKVVETGAKHGTVTVVVESVPFEVTTYRIDGIYGDARHPDTVTFTNSIEDDLSRRDFRMNAMAFHPSRGIFDPFGGLDDIRKRRLCAVGNPFDRLAEDPLRIMRALRFAAKLDFSIERRTENALRKNAPLLKSLSKERVFSELCAFLCAPRASAILLKYHGIFDIVIEGISAMAVQPLNFRKSACSILEHTAHVLDRTPTEASLRLAVLFRDIGKTSASSQPNSPNDHARESAHRAMSLLEELKAPRRLREKVCRIVIRHNEYVPSSPDGVSTLAVLEGADVSFVRDLLTLQHSELSALGFCGPQAEEAALRLEILDTLLRAGVPLSRADLAIRGSDVVDVLGISGRTVGFVLDAVLNAAIEGLPNERNALLSHLPQAQNVACEHLFEKKFKKMLDATMYDL